MTANDEGMVHVTFVGGHRAEYLVLFQKLFGLQPSVGRIGENLRSTLVLSPVVLFASTGSTLSWTSNTA